MVLDCKPLRQHMRARPRHICRAAIPPPPRPRPPKPTPSRTAGSSEEAGPAQAWHGRQLRLRLQARARRYLSDPMNSGSGLRRTNGGNVIGGGGGAFHESCRKSAAQMAADQRKALFRSYFRPVALDRGASSLASGGCAYRRRRSASFRVLTAWIAVSLLVAALATGLVVSWERQPQRASPRSPSPGWRASSSAISNVSS